MSKGLHVCDGVQSLKSPVCWAWNCQSPGILCPCFLLSVLPCGGWTRILLRYPGCPLTRSSCFGLLVIRITSAWHNLNIYFSTKFKCGQGNWKPARTAICVAHGWIESFYNEVVSDLIFWGRTPCRLALDSKQSCFCIENGLCPQPESRVTGLQASLTSSVVFFKPPENETVCSIKES